MVESIAGLRKRCQQIGSLNPYRLISIYITKLFLYTPITANQVTILSLVVGAIAVWLFTDGSYWKSITGAVLFLCYHILDLVDGEVARYRGSSSTSGMFLDEFGHLLLNISVFAAISLGLYRTYQDPQVFLVALVVVISLGVIFATFSNKLFILYSNERIGIYNSSEPYAKARGGLRQYMYIRSLVRNPRFWARSNFMWFFWTTTGIAHLVLIFSLLNMTYILLLFYAVIAPIYLIWILYLNFRELSQQDVLTKKDKGGEAT